MPSIQAVLEDRRQQLETERAALFSQAEAASSFDGVRERIDEIDGELPAVTADLARVTAERQRQRVEPALPGDEAGPITPVGGFLPLRGPLSQQFLGSTEWQEFLAAHPAGFSPKVRNLQSPKIEIAGSVLPSLTRRGLVTGVSSTSAGALITPDDTGIFDAALQRELTLVDLITRGTTGSDAVEYVRATSLTNNAAPVPEATDILAADESPASASVKPWSDLALVRVSDTVKTIAHGVPATKRALADAGQMRTLIDNFLRYGLLEELEDQVASGDGSGENFDGILHVAGTQDQAFDTSIAQTLRKAKTKVRTVGKARATGIVMNPEDWEELDLWLTLSGPGTNYRQAAQGSEPSIWGLPVVESEAVSAGTAIVADFRQAVLWDRQQTTIEATSGYMDFFMRNMVAVLAEMRAAFGVIRPSAFVICDFGS